MSNLNLQKLREWVTVAMDL